MAKRRKRKLLIDICPECKVREGDSSRKRLYKCRYCGRYFCKRHLPPRLAVLRSAIESIKDPILREKAYREWRKPNGHPDWIWTKKFFEELKTKEEERREKFFETLDRWKEKERIYEPIIAPVREKSDKISMISDISKSPSAPHKWLKKVREKFRHSLYDLSYASSHFIDGFVEFFKIFSLLLLVFGISAGINNLFSILGFTLEPIGIISFIIFYAILFLFPFIGLYFFVRAMPRRLLNRVLFSFGGGVGLLLISFIISFLTPYLPSGHVTKVISIPSLNLTIEVPMNFYQYLFYKSLAKGENYFLLEDLSQLDIFDDLLFRNDIYEEIIYELKAKVPNAQDDEIVVYLVELVQNLDYDYNKAENINFQVRFPYEVLYDGKGVCIEKSLLLIKLLSKLGYGVALIKTQNHALVGIKCNRPNLGEYCFIETTTPGWAIGQKPDGEIEGTFVVSKRFGGEKVFKLKTYMSLTGNNFIIPKGISVVASANE